VGQAGQLFVLLPSSSLIHALQASAKMGFGNSLVLFLTASYVTIIGRKAWELFTCTSCVDAKEACIHPLVPATQPLQLWLFATAGGERQPGSALFDALERGDPSVALLLGPRSVAPGEPLDVNLTLPFAQLGVRRNGTLHAHCYFFKPASAGGATGDLVAYHALPVTRHLPARRAGAKRLLASGQSGPALAAANASACPAGAEGQRDGSCANPEAVGEAAQTAVAAAEEAASAGPVTHMRPHIKVRTAHPATALKGETFPTELRSFLVYLPTRGGHETRYNPMMAPDEFLIRRDFVPVSGDPGRADPVIPFSLVPVPFAGFAVYYQLGETLKMLAQGMGLSDSDLDELRELVSGNNLRWWALTTAISLLHAVFSYLAFSNDVGFWRGKTSLEGLSVRTFVSSLVCQSIIFLKLLDGGNVSWLILTEVGVGVAIEAWKVSKIAARRGMLSPAYWRGGPGGAAPMTALESETDAADERAMRFLGYVMYPVVAVWGCYSLAYHDHRSWWSWTVQTAAYGVYLYGFVAMTPQLYINYRLKSVAHMPWRTMLYKVFNTFIDDVFAFAIEMPLSHRIACFRDDVVFFGFLYQRWIYPVDKKRANEFGRAYEEAGEEQAALQAAPPAAMKGAAPAALEGAATATQAGGEATAAGGEAAATGSLRRRPVVATAAT